MALTASRVCDCKIAKTTTPKGYLYCIHCDRRCAGGCPKCVAYREGVMQRVILKSYDSQ